MKKLKTFLLVLEKPAGHAFFAFCFVVGLFGLPLMAAPQLIIDLLYLCGYITGGIVLIISLYWNVSSYIKTGKINYGWFGDPEPMAFPF